MADSPRHDRVSPDSVSPERVGPDGTDQPQQQLIGTDEALPVDLGYSMPAEWTPHQATWLSWPHNPETWPGKFASVEPVMDRAVRILAESELVHINATSVEALRALEKRFSGVDNVGIHHIPTNDAWIRDHGATFVTRESEDSFGGRLAAVDWRYNAWGGKYPPWNYDELVAGAMAAHLQVPRFVSPLFCEGGALETNGDGLLMTTASCLLNPNRNPDWTITNVEQHLRAMLGVREILWLPGTELAGDDTDGHIDNIARFVEPGVVLVSASEDAEDDNTSVTETNVDFLRRWTSATGTTLDVRRLVLPRPLYHEAHRLPASYANFYIANSVVLLPTYGQRDRDAAAARMIGEHFPNRDVIGINCTDLVWGLGAFHCLTQQVPATTTDGSDDQ